MTGAPSTSGSSPGSSQDTFQNSDPNSIGKSVPKHATQRLREEYAQRGREDLYFFCKGILGYDLLTPHTHKHLCRFLTTCDLKRRMVQMPRSHFKTTIATISHTLQLIVRDPEIRMLVVASSAANAERFLKEIKNQVRGNELFQWLYPEVVPEDFGSVKWNAQEMTVQRKGVWREPTVDTIGSRGTVASRHYNFIKADDIIGEKELHSDSEMSKTIEWCSGLESLLVSPEQDRIDFIGTRWRRDDVYSWVEEFYGERKEEGRGVRKDSIGPFAYRSGELALFRREAMEETPDADQKQPIFPEQFSRDFFIRLMTKRPERYAAQYANNPKESGLNTFREAWLKYWHWGGEQNRMLVLPTEDGHVEIHPNNLDKIGLFDPSTGEADSREAMFIVGRINDLSYPALIVLRSKIGHYKPDEAVDTIFKWERQWNPRFFSIESYGYQGSIKYWLRQKAKSERLVMPNIREFPPKGVRRANEAKAKRIRGLQPLFRAGQFFVQEGMTELIEEYLYYPQYEFEDGLDALAQATVWWDVAEDKDRREESKAREEAIIASIGKDGYSFNQRKFEENLERARKEWSGRSERIYRRVRS